MKMIDQKMLKLNSELNKFCKLMKPCPFCGVQMGILISPEKWGYEWFGKHKSPCILECNPSGLYGRIDMLIEEWNRRI